MKNTFLIIAVLALITSCGTQQETASNTTEVAQTETDPTNTAEDTAAGVTTVDQDQQATIVNGNLQGIATMQDLQSAPFDSWFNPRYDSYTPDPIAVEALKIALQGVTIRGYMGTWCGDSKRETPKFFKLLQAVNYDMENLTLVTVDRSKSKPENLVDGYDVQRVPTFIFYRNGQELGRFVEYPRETLEADILKIASGQEYKHSYQN